VATAPTPALTQGTRFPTQAFRVVTATPTSPVSASMATMEKVWSNTSSDWASPSEPVPEPGLQTAPSTKRENTPRPKPTTEARTVFTRDLPESESRMEKRWCWKVREGKSSGGYSPFRSCLRTSCASIWRGRSRLSASGMRSLGDIDRLRLCTGDR